MSFPPGTWPNELIFVAFCEIFFLLLLHGCSPSTPWSGGQHESMGLYSGDPAGKNTADYIDRVLTRVHLSGALYVSACVRSCPQILILSAPCSFLILVTALLIVVGVAMDTSNQIEAHMLTRHYEGFMKKGLVKAR